MSSVDISLLEKWVAFEGMELTSKGTFTFGLPTFFLPVRVYYFLWEELSKLFGIEKTREIFYTAGLSVGEFAVILIKRSIYEKGEELAMAAAKNLTKMGFGPLTFISEDTDRKKASFVFKPHNEDPDFEDTFFYGFLKKGFDTMYDNPKRKLITKNKGKERDILLIEDENAILKPYVSYKVPDIFVEKREDDFKSPLPSVEKRNVYQYRENYTLCLGIEGMYLFSISYLNWLYQSLETRKESKEVFIKAGELWAEILVEKMKKKFPTKRRRGFYNFLPFFGIPLPNILEFKKTSAKFFIPKGNFDLLSKNCFGERADPTLDFVTFGIYKRMYELLFHIESTEMKIEKKKLGVGISLKHSL